MFDADIQSLLSFAQQRIDYIQASLSNGRKTDAEGVPALLQQQREEDMRVAQLKLDHMRQQLTREHQEQLQKQVCSPFGLLCGRCFSAMYPVFFLQIVVLSSTRAGQVTLK